MRLALEEPTPREGGRERERKRLAVAAETDASGTDIRRSGYGAVPPWEETGIPRGRSDTPYGLLVVVALGSNEGGGGRV